MSITTYLLVFGSGLLAGMMVLFVALKINSGDNLDILGVIKRAFSKLPGAFRRTAEVTVEPEEIAPAPQPPIDPPDQPGEDPFRGCLGAPVRLLAGSKFDHRRLRCRRRLLRKKSATHAALEADVPVIGFVGPQKQ